MTEIILTMCLSSLKNIYVKLFFMEDRAHEFYWAHFIFDQPSLARTLRDCHYHGLRTPNEGKNQRYLKNWAEVADKIYFY